MTEKTTSPRGRPARSTGHDGRARLLAAARKEFGDRGWSGTKIEHLLTASGVNPPTLYHHFGNKQGLFLEASRLAYEQVLGAFRYAVDSRTPTTTGAGIDALIDITVTMMTSDASVPKLFSVIQFELPRNDWLHDHLRPTIREFRALFDTITTLSEADTPLTEHERRASARAISAIITGLSSEAVLLGSVAEYERVASGMRTLLRTATP